MISRFFNFSGAYVMAICLCCTILFSGCRNQLQASHQQAEPLLHFQKTACLGTCPAYEAAIATDGNVMFVGFDYVPSTDTLYFKLSAERLDSLKTEITRLDYSTLQDLYPTQWSDMPSTITTFYENGKEVKRVKHMEDGPAALKQFQERLNKTLLHLAEKAAKKNLPTK